MKRLECGMWNVDFSILWRLAILALPWQTRWFWDAQLAGWPWEQGRISIYASWILMAATIIFSRSLRGSRRSRVAEDEAISSAHRLPRNARKDRKKMIVIMILAASSFIATRGDIPSLRAVGMWWVHAAILFLFFRALRARGVAWRSVAAWFCLSLIPHALLGIRQYAHQSVLASTVLGIAAQDPATPGVSVVLSEGGRILRAYGGLPHPNIFGGWLAIGSLVSILLANSKHIRKSIPLILAVLFASVLALTFSRSAIVALAVAILTMCVARNATSVRSDAMRVRNRWRIFTVVAATTAFILTVSAQWNVWSARLSGNRLEVKSVASRTGQMSDYIGVFLRHPWIGTGPNAETRRRVLDQGVGTAPMPVQPPHQVPLLVLVNFGIIGVILILLFIFPLKSSRIPHPIFLVPVLVISFFDHYFWTTWSGQTLFALTVFFAFGNMTGAMGWHSKEECASSNNLSASFMNVRPLSDRVIVKPLSREQATASGIIIPDTADKERPEQGEVVAVGPGRMKDDGSRAPMDLKVGDKVVFKKYAPDEIKVGDEEVLVIAESDIMAVLE